MQTTTLGPTDLRVSVIGMGAMWLSLEGRPSREDAIAVVHAALDSGVTLLDTADSYCRDEGDKHHNEHLLREALNAYDGSVEDVVVATKGGLMRPHGRWTRNGQPEHLRQTIRESHAALGGERPIALWQHHAPDDDVPVEDSLQPVKEAVQEGLIRQVGVSNYTVDEIERAREVVEVVSVQNQYSPWHRRPEKSGVLDYCEREGLTFLPYSPLGGGERSKRLGSYDGLAALAQEKGVSAQQLVLAWLRQQSPCVVPIPGASRPESIRDSAQAADLSLSEDEARRLDNALNAL